MTCATTSISPAVLSGRNSAELVIVAGMLAGFCGLKDGLCASEVRLPDQDAYSAGGFRPESAGELADRLCLDAFGVQGCDDYGGLYLRRHGRQYDWAVRIICHAVLLRLLAARESAALSRCVAAIRQCLKLRFMQWHTLLIVCR